MAWDEKRAQKELAAARDRLAAGRGTSDRSLERITAVSDPAAATTKKAFTTALTRAGWRPGRITAAVRRVEHKRLAAIVPAVRSALARAEVAYDTMPIYRKLLVVGLVSIVAPELAIILAMIIMVSVYRDQQGEDEDDS